MIAVGSDVILALFQGNMGIKSVYLGDLKLYERPGGFLYIQLTAKKEENTWRVSLILFSTP